MFAIPPLTWVIICSFFADFLFPRVQTLAKKNKEVAALANKVSATEDRAAVLRGRVVELEAACADTEERLAREIQMVKVCRPRLCRACVHFRVGGGGFSLTKSNVTCLVLGEMALMGRGDEERML